MKIPFNRPFVVGRELHYISKAVLTGELKGDGEFGQACEHWLQENFFPDARVLLTTSCTAALEMSALLLEFEPGDEVIVPSYTFVSTASAFLRAGAKLRFAEIDPNTMNMDLNHVETILSPRTKAVVPVHYGGFSVDMDALQDMATRHRFQIIEDAAQSLGSTFQGRNLGTFGAASCLSFHETKNVICGEGGALVLNDPTLIERAEILREKGTNRAQFFRGEVDKYNWISLGSSWVMSDILAAYLYAQLECFDQINNKRTHIFERYQEGFKELFLTNSARGPVIPDKVSGNAHLFYLIADSQAERDALLAHLKAHDIHALFHYVPLHSSPYGQELGYKTEDLPVTEEYAGRLLRLPLFFDMTDQEIDRVIASVYEFYAK